MNLLQGREEVLAIEGPEFPGTIEELVLGIITTIPIPGTRIAKAATKEVG